MNAPAQMLQSIVSECRHFTAPSGELGTCDVLVVHDALLDSLRLGSDWLVVPIRGHGISVCLRILF